MEYTKDKKALLIGRALGLARYEHRSDVGKLIDKHPDIFKNVISSILQEILYSIIKSKKVLCSWQKIWDIRKSFCVKNIIGDN